MALIRSKQIQNLAAAKLVQTPDLQLVSQTEKDAFADKYTKLEMDSTIGEVQTDIAEAVTTAASDATAKADAAKADAIASAATDAATKAGTAETNAKAYADTLASGLTTQINNAISGLSWKSPVATFADIATTYPAPEEGWVVTVADTNKIYRYDLETTSWVDFPIQVPATYLKTLQLVVADAQTVINTGIRFDGTGVYKTGHLDVSLSINGFVMSPGADKDYTTAKVAEELVVTYNNRDFALEATDEILITYTHFDVV